MLKQVAIAFAMVFVATCNAGIPYTKDQETHSTKVQGTLLCGKEPLKNAVVRLFRGNSDDVSDTIGEATTDASGTFIISGNTANYATEKANLDPFLKIYHKCDGSEGSSYRRVTLRYPRTFVSAGTYPLNTYNIGKLNLELIYPAETQQKVIQGYTGPKN